MVVLWSSSVVIWWSSLAFLWYSRAKSFSSSFATSCCRLIGDVSPFSIRVCRFPSLPLPVDDLQYKAHLYWHSIFWLFFQENVFKEGGCKWEVTYTQGRRYTGIDTLNETTQYGALMLFLLTLKPDIFKRKHLICFIWYLWIKYIISILFKYILRIHNQ